MLTLSAACESPKSEAGRTSKVVAPCCLMDTDRLKYGGRSGKFATIASTKRSRSVNWSAQLVAASCPIVVNGADEICLPHNDPAPWAG